MVSPALESRFPRLAVSAHKLGAGSTDLPGGLRNVASRAKCKGTSTSCERVSSVDDYENMI